MDATARDARELKDFPKRFHGVYTAPGRPFFPTMRFYGPEKPLFDKTWKLPDVEKAN
jgi:hypothetical protein